MNNLIADTAKRLIESASPDFLACLAAGVPVEYSSEKTLDGGMRITATTIDRVAVVREPNGQTTVYRLQTRK